MSDAPKWLRIAHRASVIVRALSGENLAQIQTDHDHELARADQLIGLLRRVGDMTGEPKAQRAQRTSARRH